MTERLAHSPGPWQLDDWSDGELWVNSSNKRPVCMITASGRVTEQDKVDADLIVAAPDMLAALQQIMRYADGSTDPAIVSTATAAIAKATGK